MAVEDESEAKSSAHVKEDVRYRSPSQLTTVAEVLSTLSAIQSREATISAALSDLLSSREPVNSSLRRLNSLSSHLQELQGDTNIFFQKVSATAETAQRIGECVRDLDEEMKRVKESVDMVGQVQELKSSLQMLLSAMESKEYDAATRHCARAMSIPSAVLSSQFSEAVVPAAQSPLPPAETLQNARESLLLVFQEEFERATRARDAAMTSRYFKMFPLIGWEAEGLAAYSDFVVELVRTRPQVAVKSSSPVYYIMVITALLEHVAHIIDQHQPVVEKHYGRGKMLSVAQTLLKECERTLKRYLDGWEEERSLKRKLGDLSRSTFPSLSASPSTAKEHPGMPEDSSMDAREIDRMVSESAAMAARWTTFCHFLEDRLLPEDDAVADRDAEASSVLQSDPQQVVEVAQLIKNSGCNQLFEGLMLSCYLPLEIWYLRFIIDKALRNASIDTSSQAPVSTIPDDVFYILKIILVRLLSTGSLKYIDIALPKLLGVMDQEFADSLKRRLDDIYAGQAITGQGSRGEKLERENRLAFITHLNDLDLSASHMEKLVSDVLESTARSQSFGEKDVTTVSDQLRLFNDITRKLRAFVKSGVEQLFNQLVRPRLRQFIADLFKDVTYVLSDDLYSTIEYQDQVSKRFRRSWSTLLDNFKDSFSATNYRTFFRLAIDNFVKPWERVILNMRFTELGAIRLDHDIRAILDYLSSQTAFGDARERFQRLQHISMLLNLDMEENVDEFYSSSGISWKVTMSEAQSIVALRV